MKRVDLRYNKPTGGPLQMNVDTSMVGYTNDPVIFGPSFWFTLHNGAVSYPENPSAYVKAGMIQLIRNLPLLIPCKTPCREHFYDYVNRSDLNSAVASRENLFRFFVNIHNIVNSRYGKEIVTLAEAKEMYGFDTLRTTLTINYT